LGSSIGKRTGLPLGDYKEKWESLPEAPVLKCVYPTTGPLTGLFMSKPHGALQNIVKVKASRYMSSHPGPDNAGGNTNIHPVCYWLIEGREVEFDKIYRINETLNYRQIHTQLADTYCYALQLGVPEGRHIDQFDQRKWENFQLREKNEGSPILSKSARDL
jgi:hypothetical protein